MKWISIAWMSFCGILLLSSCKKDNSVPGSSGDLPKAITEEVMSSWLGHLTDSSILTYDGSNRLTGITSITTPGSKVVYQYNTDHTTTMDVYVGGQVTIHNKIWMGTNGFADSSFQYNDGYDTTTTKYIYNASDQLIEQREYLYNSLAGPGSYLDNRDVYSYDNNGNITRDESFVSVTTFDYYPDLLNPFSLEAFIPRTKNLVKTETMVSSGTTSTLTHVYKFDSKNRLVEDASVADDGSTDTKRYTY